MIERAWLAFDNERGNLRSLVERGVTRDDYDEPMPDDGYHIVGGNYPHFSSPEPTKYVSLSVKAGSLYDNQVKLETGAWRDPPDAQITTYPIFRRALEAIASAWPCPWAHAYAFKLDYDKQPTTPGQPPMPGSMFHLGWISYLSAPLVAGLSIPLGLTVEPTPGGGVILSAVRDRFDPTNPAHFHQSRRLTDFMIAHVRDGNHPARSGILLRRSPNCLCEIRFVRLGKWSCLYESHFHAWLNPGLSGCSML